jgi:hypothetical protein
MLGLQVSEFDKPDVKTTSGWNELERAQLRESIAERRPFLDFVFHRVNSNGSRQQFRVSGEPMFDQSCRFLGYRGIGVEIFDNSVSPQPASDAS